MIQEIKKEKEFSEKDRENGYRHLGLDIMLNASLLLNEVDWSVPFLYSTMWNLNTELPKIM